MHFRTWGFQLANGARGTLGALEFEYLNGTKGSFEDLNLGFDYFRVTPTPSATETTIYIETLTVGTEIVTESKLAETESPEPETTQSKGVE